MEPITTTPLFSLILSSSSGPGAGAFFTRTDIPLDSETRGVLPNKHDFFSHVFRTDTKPRPAPGLLFIRAISSDLRKPRGLWPNSLRPAREAVANAGYSHARCGGLAPFHPLRQTAFELNKCSRSAARKLIESSNGKD